VCNYFKEKFILFFPIICMGIVS